MIDRATISETFASQQLEYLGTVKLAADKQAFTAFRQWIAEGRHGEMQFMENYQELRQQPSLVEPGLNYALIFAWCYFQGDSLHHRQDQARIAQYARLRDYHKVMKTKAIAVAKELEQQGLWQGPSRVTIDSAPLLERALATKTQRGFIGKNTCYIHPEMGSYLLLGELLIPSVTWPIDTAANVDHQLRGSEGGCGSCRRCQVYCPTGALDQDYRIDARRCLSYWTIEHRGLIPVNYWQWLPKYWFGCDLCQLACPYNRQLNVVEDLPIKSGLESLDLYDVATMNQQFYQQTFGGTPMTRAKIEGLRRNALIVLIVNEDPRVKKLLLQSDRQSPLVQQTLAQIIDYQGYLARVR